MEQNPEPAPEPTPEASGDLLLSLANACCRRLGSRVERLDVELERFFIAVADRARTSCDGCSSRL